jgi:hypothetical protein
MFKEDTDQWASRFNVIENVDIDVLVTKLAVGYITSINVIRAEYKDGMVMCNSLDNFDVSLHGKETGAASTIERNHLKLKTMDRPERMNVYKFEYQFQYEE